MTLLIVRRCLRSLWMLAFLRLAAVGCAGPEPLRRHASEDGGAGTDTGVAGNGPGGTAGNIGPAGFAGTAGADAALPGNVGLGGAGVSGEAGATGGAGTSGGGRGGNTGPDGGAAGVLLDGSSDTGAAGGQGGVGGMDSGADRAGSAGGAFDSGTAGASADADAGFNDYCDRTRWTATASIGASSAPQGDDGDLTTRFTSGRPMQAGDYYQVDFTGAVYLTAVTLNNTQTSADDFAANYSISGSINGVSWTNVASAPGVRSSTTISFAKTRMRYVRLQVATANINPGIFFSIGEFQVTCSD